MTSTSRDSRSVGASGHRRDSVPNDGTPPACTTEETTLFRSWKNATSRRLLGSGPVPSLQRRGAGVCFSTSVWSPGHQFATLASIISMHRCYRITRHAPDDPPTCEKAGEMAGVHPLASPPSLLEDRHKWNSLLGVRRYETLSVHQGYAERQPTGELCVGRATAVSSSSQRTRDRFVAGTAQRPRIMRGSGRDQVGGREVVGHSRGEQPIRNIRPVWLDAPGFFRSPQYGRMEGECETTPGRIRTCDLRFRKPLLYPLSYEGEVAYSTSDKVSISPTLRFGRTRQCTGCVHPFERLGSKNWHT